VLASSGAGLGLGPLYGDESVAQSAVSLKDVLDAGSGAASGDASPKGFTDSTHRLIPPEETLARVRRFLPVMGITRIANVTGLDTVGIPVVMVCRPNSRSVSVSQGKGFDLAAAKASGVMESIESYHAERIDLPLKLGGYEDLRYQNPMIEVARLPRLADSRFTPHTQLLWIEGEDLLGGGRLWLPYELVHLNYTLPMPTGHGCFVASSNGLASGNHRLEAISHGITEVVERDATTLWHLLDDAARQRTRLDLDSVEDPCCRALLAKFAEAGVMVAVWEITSDVGIPAFLCRILQQEGPPSSTLRPASGMGCHAMANVALLRALTEAAQSRLTFISGARDDMARDDYERFLDRETYDAWRATMEQGRPQRSFRQVPSFQGSTFEEDVAWQLERLRAVGIEQLAVVDLTKPAFGIPVVRVVIPGLEGLDSSPKFVPGARVKSVLREAI
jgi:ribosomal protein S12 methylthiotransferase accessory factor